jgi:hypothetical protein
MLGETSRTSQDAILLVKDEIPILRRECTFEKSIRAIPISFNVLRFFCSLFLVLFDGLIRWHQLAPLNENLDQLLDLSKRISNQSYGGINQIYDLRGMTALGSVLPRRDTLDTSSSSY